MRLAICLLAVAAAARGQVATARLAGTVTDPSAAAVPNAALVITDISTGSQRPTVTNGRGAYAFEQLPPGSYKVAADAPGFQRYEADLSLELHQRAKYDIRLRLPGERTEMTVTAAVSPVATEDASLGYRMDSAKIQSLPLATRTVISLVTLGPGAIPRQLGGFVHDVNNDVQEGSRGSVALNPPINGSRTTMNAFLLDGAYNTDRNTFAMAVYPPMDAVQEFRIQSALAPAEFPQSGGGAIDVVTKSGGKALHGSAFEYFRNEFSDARNYFDDPKLPRPIFRQNQFGGSLGGPVPKARRTFFYGIYEGLRQKFGTSASSIVPNQAARSGDFSGQSLIHDPLTLDAAGRRTAFAGNRIPQARIDPVAAAYLEKYEPLPNSGGSSYRDATPGRKRNDSASARIDYHSARASLTGRYTLNEENHRLAGTFPVRPTSEQVRAQQAAVGHTFGARTWVNEARISYTRLRTFDVPESAFRINVAQQLGLVDPPSDPFTFGLPQFNVQNYTTVTDSPSAPQIQRDNLWRAADGVSLVRGRHTLKTGGDFIRYQFNYLQSNLTRGRYDYTGVFTSLDGSGVGSGNALADFLLGFPQNTTRTKGSGQAYLRQSVFAGYVQDDWRIGPQLTVNLGLRYEYATPYNDASGNLQNLDYSMLPQAPRLARVSSAFDPDRNNFAPRAGFAWLLPGTVRTVFRGGYGVYFSGEIAAESYDLLRNGLLNEQNRSSGNQRPVLTTRDGFPRTASSGLPSYFGMDPQARTPYVQQWTASVQRELPGRTLLEIAYLGTKGTKLGRYRRFNTPAHVETGENLPPRPGNLQTLRTFPSLGVIIQRQHIANSSYHSLQMKVEKSASARLSLLASFVWSKAIDDAESPIPGLFESSGAQDERNLTLERGLSFKNPGRRIAAGYVFQLPESRVAGPILRRWSLSGTVTLQDGTPVSPFYFALDFANSGTPNRPNVVPGKSVTLPRSQRTAERFFNPEAFTAPAPFTFGNAGRNTIPGPGNNVFDFALQREFRVREGHAIRFRAESFNTFNHPNWGIPGPYPDFGPFFGRIFTSGEPRRMQFALRYDF